MTDVLKSAYDAYHEGRSSPKQDAYRTRLQRLHGRLARFDYTREQGVLDYLADAKAGGRLLDLGCGAGTLLAKLHRRGQFDVLFGAEHNALALEQARGQLRGAPSVQLIPCDLDADFPRVDGLDWVVSLDTLEHLVAPHHLIWRSNLALKPAGQFIVTVPNAAFLPNRIRMATGRLPVTGDWGEHWDSLHLHYFNHRLMRRTFEQLGFRLVEFRPLGIFPTARRPWLELLCGSVFGIFEKVRESPAIETIRFEP